MNNAQYQAVTDRIVGMLEAGTAPWQKSWSAGAAPADAFQRPLRATGEPYRGANCLNLWAAATVRGFNSRHWLTFKGAKAVGGSVRKGAKAELAFYVGSHTVADAPADGGDATARTISFLRAYHVFNANECENLPARFAPVAPVPAVIDDNRMPAVDAFMAATGASVAHGGDRAYYMPSTDAIRMPFLAQFNTPADYYATILHEGVHWTSAASRCDRQLGKRFGDDAYAAEELIAELGAAFLCADLGVSAAPRADHASYLAEWLRVLKADNRAIFRAAALAEKAAGFMHGCQADAAPAAPEPAPELAMAA